MGRERDVQDLATTGLRNHRLCRHRVGHQPGALDVEAYHSPKALRGDVLRRGQVLPAGGAYEAQRPREPRPGPPRGCRTPAPRSGRRPRSRLSPRAVRAAARTPRPGPPGPPARGRSPARARSLRRSRSPPARRGDPARRAWRAWSEQASTGRSCGAPGSSAQLTSGGALARVRAELVSVAGEELLEHHRILAHALRDLQQRLHGGLLLDLLVDEPLHEALTGVVVRLPRDLEQLADRDRHLLLVLEGQPDRLDVVGEIVLGRGHLPESQLRPGVVQVIDHPHGVTALFVGLVVEELREARERHPVVVRADGGVLVGGQELAADLLVQRLDETLGWHPRKPRALRGPSTTNPQPTSGQTGQK